MNENYYSRLYYKTGLFFEDSPFCNVKLHNTMCHQSGNSHMFHYRSDGIFYLRVESIIVGNCSKGYYMRFLDVKQPNLNLIYISEFKYTESLERLKHYKQLSAFL